MAPPVNGSGGWAFSILYTFSGGADGNLLYVYSPLLWRNGALFGIASGGSDACGSLGCGSVFRLRPPVSGKGGWKLKTLYSFTGGSDSGILAWIVGGEGQKALYVATALGNGAIAKLVPSGQGGWSESVITKFRGGSDGDAPYNLLLTSGGTIYGTANTVYTGYVFSLSQSGGNWTRSKIAKIAVSGYGPTSLAFGPNGSLIGTIYGDPDFFAGAAFELTPSGQGKWTFAELYDFTNGPDEQPVNIVTGLGGNLFGVFNGGYGDGSLFELQPSHG